ncbi:hypothetical protein [Streptomyces sp. NPDC059783]|uniref:hypothetical protein n=1 Tax=Streptomyces sp. NPDC059783 TaxID=3346944 RepID=UPI00365E3648
MTSETAPKAGTSRRRVYDGLKQMLTDTDAYPPGTKLSTYTEIRKQYGVASLVPLLDEGLLIVHLGVGTFVSRRHARRPKRRRAPQPPDTP